MPFGPLPFGSYPASATNGNIVGPGIRGNSKKRDDIEMRGLIVGSMVALAMVSGALADDQRNVNVVNETGYSIKFLGFNNPGDNDWSDNELGSVLGNGQSVFVKFNTSDEGCVWNFKIEWADPGYPGVLWRDVDLCKVNVLKLHYNRPNDTTSYSAE
jgi:hypothetical protein